MKKNLIALAVLELILLAIQFLHYYLVHTHTLIAHRATASSIGLLLESPALLAAIIRYISAILLIHVAKIAVVILATKAIRPSSAAKETRAVLLVWVMFSIAIELINAYEFPHLGNELLKVIAAWFPAWIAWLVLSGTVILSLLKILHLANRFYARNRVKTTTIVIGAAFFTIPLIFGSNATRQATDQFPDVIIFGIDSLQATRPEVMQSCIPYLSSRLNEGITFSNALTPLARTHPAWISILTGQYPTRHGARFNLTDPSGTVAETNLPNILKTLGYTTVFATDETRFSNMLPEFGFNRIYGPGYGAQDFIIGAIHNDSLSNLAGLTRSGRKLFPEVYGNRAVWRLYKPEHFAGDIAAKLGNINGPLFLSIHLTLGHWPYSYSESRYNAYHSPAKSALAYCNSLKELDRQAQAIFSALQSLGKLDNAIIVTLSDHGERIYGTTESPYFTEGEVTSGKVPIWSGGHGTAVADELQNRVLINIHKTGDAPLQARPDSFPASLIDIAPTILNLAGYKYSSIAYDGLDLLNPTSAQQSDRLRYVESGLMVPAILAGTIDEAGAFRQTQDFYTIVPGSTRLRIRDELVDDLIGKKQLAVYRPDLTGIAILHRGNERCPSALQVDMQKSQWQEFSHPISKQPSRSPGELSDDFLLTSLAKHFAIDVEQELDCAESMRHF